MGRFRELLRRLFGTLRKRPNDRLLEEELRAHLEFAAEDRRHRGLPDDEARRQANIQYGGVSQALESVRDQRGFPWLDDLLRDLRHCLRMMRRSPGFSSVAILSLALGIGANTALFSVVDTLVLRKLPVRNPDELVLFQWTSAPRPKFVTSMTYDATAADRQTGLRTNQTFPYPMLQQFRENSSGLAAVFGFARLYPFPMTEGGEAAIASGEMVTGNYFSSLGVGAAAGRVIEESDDRPDAPLVAVLSHHHWEQRLASDPAVIGKSIVVKGKTFTVVGVAPAAFTGTLQVDDSPDVFLPMSAVEGMEGSYSLTRPDDWWMWIMGRMKAGVVMGQVRGSLQGVFERTALAGIAIAPSKDGAAATAAPLLGVVTGSRGLSDHRSTVSQILLVLTIIVGLVLLIACANVASLLLARSAARQKELTVRLAIGAGRFRLFRQLLAESILLAVCGGICGMLLAYFGKDFLGHWSPSSETALPTSPLLNVRVLAFTTGVSILTGISFGLIPALRATRHDLRLPANRAGVSIGGRSYIGRGFLAAQIALSVVLLVGSGLFIRTLNNVRHTVTGIDAASLLQFSIASSAYDRVAAATASNIEAIVEQISAMPGVRSVTISGSASGGTDPGNNGRVLTDPAGKRYSVTMIAIRSNYFETMGIPLELGRTFTAADNAGAPRVLIVNEAFVRTYAEGANPLGLILGGGEVVGVVRDSKYTQLRKDTEPTAYTSYLQDGPGRTKIWVRADANPASYFSAVRTVVHSVDPYFAISNVKTLTDQIDESMVMERTLTAFSTLFGVLALVLTGIGLYGVTSYSVARRTAEIGIRMAIGARQKDVLTLVVREGMILVMFGIAVGIAMALTVGRLAASLLYGLAPNDVVSIGFAVSVTFGVALLASYIPAHRAANVDPTVALRHQ